MMYHTDTAKTAEIDRNLVRFLDMLPSMLAEHRDEYTLLRDTEVIRFFASALDAQIAGNQRFVDKLFSIQLVQDTAEELGYFAYALHRR